MDLSTPLSWLTPIELSEPTFKEVPTTVRTESLLQVVVVPALRCECVQVVVVFRQSWEPSSIIANPANLAVKK